MNSKSRAARVRHGRVVYSLPSRGPVLRCAPARCRGSALGRMLFILFAVLGAFVVLALIIAMWMLVRGWV